MVASPFTSDMREIEFIIEEKDDSKAIRDYLREFGVSSSLLTKLKQLENGITLNGEFAKTIEHISTGDKLKIKLVENGKTPVPVQNEQVKILYNDEDIIVLNKPPLMPVHESKNHRGDTLANVTACYLPDNTPFRAVYRLDRDTSGLVLVAKNELSASKLASKIKKKYYAVCSGIIENKGTIDLPIRRVADSIITRGVFPDGDRAVTHYKAVSHQDNSTLLEINLETGRTHQIRVHFSHIGHALLGDSLYGGECDRINRQALHCKTISFIHPVTNEKITVDSDFPDDIKGLI